MATDFTSFSIEIAKIHQGLRNRRIQIIIATLNKTKVKNTKIINMENEFYSELKKVPMNNFLVDEKLEELETILQPDIYTIMSVDKYKENNHV